jgi:MoxR-like ATPase
MDRFMMKISIGYPSREAEKGILKGGSRRDDLYSLAPRMDQTGVLEIQELIKDKIYISDKLLDYILEIVKATRESKYLLAGLSTRGSLAITYTAKVNAYFNNRDFVIPEDIRTLAEYTIPHRVKFREEYENLDKGEIITSVIEQIQAPV